MTESPQPLKTNYEIKVIGDSFTGKTELINQCKEIASSNQSPDLLQGNAKTKNSILSDSISIKLLDTEKDEQIDSIVPQSADGIILVYDVTSRNSFNNINYWIEKIKSSRDISTLALILVANKIDLIYTRDVTYEEGLEIAERYKMNYFEISKENSQNLYEALCYLISCIYSKEFEKVERAKNSEGISKENEEKMKFVNIALGKKKSIDINIAQDKISINGTHDKDASTSDLKKLLAGLEKENDANVIYKKIRDIETFLETMKPKKCDINYQKLIPILFIKQNLISNSIDKKYTYVNIYLQFLIVFPEIKEFISDYNKKYKIINLIHSMRMKGKRYTFYQLFTNNFSNFEQLRCKDLIAIFNFLFIQYITDINKYINSLSELENIIKALFEMLKEITKENKPVGRTINSPYIIEVITAFGDVFIYILVHFLLSTSKNENELEQLITKFIEIIPIFFEIHNTIQPIDSFIFKLICLYCIIYSFFSTKNNNSVIEHIINTIKDNSKVCISNLFQILYSMKQTDREKNILLLKFTKKLYLPFYYLTLEWDIQDNENIIENSFLKDYDYDYDMGRVVFNNEIINSYRGCFLLLTNLYTNFLETIAIDDKDYPSFIILKHLLLITKMEKEEGKSLFDCSQEIILFIFSYIKMKSSKFEIYEWELAIESVHLMSSNYMNFNHELYHFICSHELLPLFKLLGEFLDSRKATVFMREEIKEFIIDIFYYQSYINSKLAKYLYFFSMSMFKRECIEFLKPCLLLGFHVIIQDSKSSATSQSEDKKKDDVVNEEKMIFDLLEIIEKKDTKEREEVEQVVISLYRTIVELLCDNSDKIDELFAKFIFNVITYSAEHYKKAIKVLFDLPPIEPNKSYKEKELLMIQLKTKYSLNIFNNYLKWANINNKKEILYFLIDLSLSKRVFYDMCYYEAKGAECRTVSLINLIIAKTNINEEGRVFIGDANRNSIVYRKSLQDNTTDSLIYIDIDAVFSNIINNIGVLTEYPNQNQISKNFETKWNSYKIKDNEVNFTYFIMENSINSLHLISKDNFMKILLVYLHIIQNIKLPIDCNFYFCFSSIINFLMKINYLMNYKTEVYYLNSLDLQRTEAISSDDVIIKDFILSSIVLLVESNCTNDYRVLSLLLFYFNSTLDQPLSGNCVVNINNQTIYSINRILLLLLKENSIHKNLFILTMLFILKDILKYSSQIINYIYIILVISQAKDLECINANLSSLISIPLIENDLDHDISQEMKPFYTNLSDLVCFYYISYLPKDNFGKSCRIALSSLLSDTLSNDRDILFESVINDYSDVKRTAITEKDLLNDYEDYSMYSQKNNRTYFIKKNNIIEVTPSNYYLYSLSSLTAKDKEDKFIFLKEETEKKNKVKNEEIISLLKTPSRITHKINIFYYPKEYHSLSIDNLLNESDLSEKSERFDTFISKLGTISINDKGSTVVSYEDSFYRLIFEVIKPKQKKEEKIKLIKENCVNIIWMENEFSDITNINSIVDSINTEKKKYIITITPKSQNHFLLRTKQNSFPLNTNMSKIILNYHYNVSIENYLCDNYYINTRALSSIRYLLRCVTIINEWYFYFNKKSVFPFAEEREEEQKSLTNCFYNRLQLLKEINKAFYY